MCTSPQFPLFVVEKTTKPKNNNNSNKTQNLNTEDRNITTQDVQVLRTRGFAFVKVVPCVVQR